MVLLYNAAAKNSVVLDKLPQYCLRHYPYMHDMYPECIPLIKVGQRGGGRKKGIQLK